YSAVRLVAERLGYQPEPMFISFPDTLLQPWVVAPGAALAAALLVWTLGPAVPGQDVRRLLVGTALGAVLGWANAPVSVLVALVLDIVLGGSHTLGGVLTLWWQGIPWILSLAWPVALPCGAWMGLLVASLGLLEKRN
ncbi:MAG: hypothetical protein AB1758_28980, partial [Candidatus Eremiobacterota bacterium]